MELQSSRVLVGNQIKSALRAAVLVPVVGSLFLFSCKEPVYPLAERTADSRSRAKERFCPVG